MKDKGKGRLRQVPNKFGTPDIDVGALTAGLEALVAAGLLEHGSKPGTYRMTAAGKAYVESMPHAEGAE